MRTTCLSAVSLITCICLAQLLYSCNIDIIGGRVVPICVVQDVYLFIVHIQRSVIVKLLDDFDLNIDEMST